jgi:hypothetical protein
MSKEADRATAFAAFLAELGSILGRMKPALVYSMGVWAAITLETETTFVVRAWNGEVLYDARIATSGILSGVSKGAGSPVVYVSLAASCDLEVIHTK